MLFNDLFDTKINNQDIVGLNDELKCIYIWNLFSKTNDSILFVVNTLFEATNFYQKIPNYTDQVLLFPMDDFLTSEALAISPELKIKRLETLKELSINNKKIVVTNLMGYLRYLPNKENFKSEWQKTEERPSLFKYSCSRCLTKYQIHSGFLLSFLITNHTAAAD